MKGKQVIETLFGEHQFPIEAEMCTWQNNDKYRMGYIYIYIGYEWMDAYVVIA